MKSLRQLAILEIIRQQSIETQEQLAAALQQRGFTATQATISRDIKELRLLKTPGANGAYQYASEEKAETSLNERLIRIFSASVLDMHSAYNQIILKTLSGSANSAAEAIDYLNWPEIMGTLAGDNTILLLVRSVEEVPLVLERLHAMRK